MSRLRRLVRVAAGTCRDAVCTIALLIGVLDASATAQSPTSIVAEGTTRALVVYVRFSDDTSAGDPCLDFRGWPLRDDRLPDYASALFASEPTPPFADSSVTAYFHRQSAGRFTLIADTYPQVVTTEHPAYFYRRSSGRGYGYLTEEILRGIDPSVDYSSYDQNPRDGVLDHVFIVVRRDEAATFTGVADLRGADRVAGGPGSELQFDGVRVDWARSGTYLIHERPGHILSQPYMTRLIAHEFGHHLWNSRGLIRGHLQAITSNQTPENDTRTIGYVLMAGRGGGVDAGGDLLVSGFEQDLIGWADPTTFRTGSGPARELTLGDAYTTGDLIRIDTEPEEGMEFSFYLQNRQRVGWFDQYRVHEHEGCPSYEMGLLRTTGVLVMMVDRSRFEPALDILPSDNTLRLSVDNHDYRGDLFGPNGSDQISPWSAPSTNLPGGTPTWMLLDRIRMSPVDSTRMVLDFVPDVRYESVTVRRPSTMAEESNGLVLESLGVASNTSLDIVAASINVLTSVTIDSSSTATIAADAGLRSPELHLANEAILRIHGSLAVDRQITRESGSALILEAGSVLTSAGVRRHVFRQLTLPSRAERAPQD